MAPATRAAKIVETVAFCKGTIGLDHVDVLIDSSRIHGAVRRSIAHKASHSNKDNLLVQEVTALEWECYYEDSLTDRIFARYCCFSVYARVRFDDGQHVSFKPSLDLDAAGGKTGLGHAADIQMGLAL
jgi:hypothetical protein